VTTKDGPFLLPKKKMGRSFIYFFRSLKRARNARLCCCAIRASLAKGLSIGSLQPTTGEHHLIYLFGPLIGRLQPEWLYIARATKAESIA